MKPLIMAVLLAWLALTLALGISGAFITPIGEIPYRIAIGIAAPIIVFVAAYWVSAKFRTVVLTSDLSLLTAIQAWRFAGFAFIALYAYGVLPGNFAWPAGLGDIDQPAVRTGRAQGAYDAYLRVTGIDALAEEFSTRGADILDGPEDRVYGQFLLENSQRVKDHAITFLFTHPLSAPGQAWAIGRSGREAALKLCKGTQWGRTPPGKG